MRFGPAVRFAGPIIAALLFVLAMLAAVLSGGIVWIVPVVIFGALAALGIDDLVQRRHSILRNYPILGHARFMLESIRPEMQQYFIERIYDGRPFDRDTRTSIYERAKGIPDEQAYGAAKGDFAHDTGEGGLDQVPPQGERCGLGARHGLLRRAHQGRRL